jgi:hypothetical protein
MAEGLIGLHEKGGQTLAEGLDQFEEDVRRQLSAFAIQESGLEEGAHQKVLEDCIQKIREKRAKNVRGELLRRIKDAESDRERKSSKPSCWSVQNSREERVVSERKKTCSQG